jgi:glycosyltransferase involved in cell wall biosynthesis
MSTIPDPPVTGPTDGRPQNQTARVTVGMPVYNGARFLRTALDGLLAQTYPDFIVLISDNCSTDATQAICEEYGRKDSRVRYLRQVRNRGAAWNFNQVVHLATSPYFFWHACDDLADPDYIAVCVKALDAQPDAALAYTEAVPIDAAGMEQPWKSQPLSIGSSSIVERFSRCLDPFPYVENVLYGLMRTELLRKTRLYGGFGGGDRAFTAELSLYGPFVRIEGPLFRRRLRLEQQTAKEFQQYNTGRTVRFDMKEWRVLRWNLQSIHRAPRPAGGRGALYGALVRKFRRDRLTYLWELKQALAASLKLQSR